MTTIISFVLVLGILILVHEFGHFIVARMSGVGVERFSIGFGPVLLRYRGKETEYCLSLVPLGGYVKMMGDDENPLEGGKTGTLDPKRAFNLKPLAVRFLIVFAGPAMNFVLAVVNVQGGVVFLAERRIRRTNFGERLLCQFGREAAGRFFAAVLAFERPGRGERVDVGIVHQLP